MIETLEFFIRNQELFNKEKIETDTVLIKIKEIVEDEREIEKEYQQLIDSEKNMLEQEHQKVRAKVMQQYNYDVDAAVSKIKNEIMKKWQEAVNSSYEKGEKRGYNKGYEDASICVPCLFCSSDIFVQPGSVFICF